MVRSAGLIFCLGLALGLPASTSLTDSGAAFAQATLVETPNIQAPRVMSSRTSINGFDWLEKKAVVIQARYEQPAASIPHQIGRGSYICSPAGFGRKSRCYAN